MKTKIYTRHGDNGFTSVFRISQIPKSSPKLEVIGQIDELNAILGVVNSFLQNPEIEKLIRDLQTKLFEIAAEMAGSPKFKLSSKDVKTLEQAIDHFEAPLAPIKNFVFPGGAKPAAFLHLSRTVCRRAERRLVALSQGEKLNPILISFLNRLSDLLFILARVVNKRVGFIEQLWPKKD